MSPCPVYKRYFSVPQKVYDKVSPEEDDSNVYDMTKTRLHEVLNDWERKVYDIYRTPYANYRTPFVPNLPIPHVNGFTVQLAIVHLYRHFRALKYLM